MKKLKLVTFPVPMNCPNKFIGYIEQQTHFGKDFGDCIGDPHCFTYGNVTLVSLGRPPYPTYWCSKTHRGHSKLDVPVAYSKEEARGFTFVIPVEHIQDVKDAVNAYNKAFKDSDMSEHSK